MSRSNTCADPSLSRQNNPSPLCLILPLLAAGFGLTALCGWIAGLPILASFAAGRMPMAPSTALLFVLYGTAVCFHALSRQVPRVHRLSLVFTLSTTASVLFLSVLSVLDIHPVTEHLGIPIYGTMNGVPIGHISPVTAFCFTFCGFSFMGLLLSESKRRWRALAAFVSASLVLLASMALLLAYLLGAPLLYGSSFIPPALTTCLAFLALSTSLALSSRRLVWHQHGRSHAGSARATLTFFLVFILMSAGIATTGYIYFRNYQRHYLANVVDEISAIAGMKTDGLVDWRKERLQDAAILFRNASFQALAGRYFENPGDNDTQHRLREWLSLYPDQHHYDQVCLIDRQGVIRMTVADGRNKPDTWRFREHIPKVLKSAQATLVDLRYCDLCSKANMSVLAPVFGEAGGRPLGVVAMQIDPATYIYPFLSKWPTRSRTGETLIVRRDGNSALYLSELKFKKNSALIASVSLDREKFAAVKAALGQEEVVKGVSYRGTPVIAVIRAIPGSPWSLVVQMDESEVYAPLRKRLWEMVALIGVLLLTTGTGLGLIWRQQRVRFYREKSQVAERLRESERQYHLLFENMLNGFAYCRMIFDQNDRPVDFVYIDVNNAFEELTGLSGVVGRPVTEVIPGIKEANPELFDIYGRVALTGLPERFDFYFKPLSRMLSVSAYSTEHGYFAGVFEDVTDRKRAENALQAERDNLAAIFSSSPVGMLLLDTDMMIVDANSVVAGMLSRSPDEIIHQRTGNGLGCVHSFENELGCGYSQECGGCDLRQDILQVLGSRDSVHGAELQASLIINGREEHPWLRISAEPVTIDSRKHVVVAVDDITELKLTEKELVRAKANVEEMNRQLEEALHVSTEYAKAVEVAKGQIEENAIALSHQATHDALTGLPNRVHFERHLSELVKGADKSSHAFAVLFLDLDKFKLINDTLGHKIGDLLLIEVAERLKSCLRSGDVLARMGGDEFTVILPRCRRRSSAESVASRMIDSISRPFEIEGRRFVIGVSIGLASCPSDGSDVVTLLKHADASMYKAKQAGRGTFRWYTGDVDQDNQSRIEMETDIHCALEGGQFKVYYQPIVSLANNRIVAAEALLRWEHPEKGMISPSLFIPIAEEIGLIGKIGDYVLRTACSQTVEWEQEGIHLSQIAVNVSTAQLRDTNWLNSVAAALCDAGMDPRRLNLELTETDFAADYESLRKTLHDAQQLGMGISIDDFGMGQSSLSRLKDIHVIHLKIDGSFVRDIGHNENDKALLRSIIEMAHGQGVEVTAEWVEAESQMDVLRSSGCDFAQGYMISPALSAKEFAELVRRRTSADWSEDAA